MKKAYAGIIMCIMAGLLAISATSCCSPACMKVKKGIRVFSYPEDYVALTNGVAYFTVVAAAANTNNSLTYQWQQNGTNLVNGGSIGGATAPTLTITNPQKSNVGFYTCLVTDGHGTRVVRSLDCCAPGARLFVVTSTNTDVFGPFQPGGGTQSSCPSGTWIGWVTFKNLSGSTWWTPPSGKTSVNISDITDLVSPWITKVQIVDNTTLAVTCGPGSTGVSTSVNTSHAYQFTTFAMSGSATPPTGSAVGLHIVWSP